MVAVLVGATLLLSSLPALLGAFLGTLPGHHFVGAAYNIDDFCNYLSWLRQTADGHFFLRNLFTTDPQRGLLFNVYFFALGLCARLTHCALPLVLQLARVIGGIVLLLLIHRLYCHVLSHDRAARLTAFGFACLSSGLGWLRWPAWADKNPPGSPIDAWQPEAYTFLSLATSSLFVWSSVFIVGAIYALLRGEETGQWKWAWTAGACGAILGNMHSYDVLHVAAAWGLFLVVWTACKRGRGVAGTWKRAILAFALLVPTTAYQYYAYQTETVFRERAEVQTLSPVLWHYIAGYGIVFYLAVAGAWGRKFIPAKLVMVCWAVAGLLVIYLPVAFQRKMLMGEHVPLCLLAGWGAARLTRTMTTRKRAVALAALVLFSFPSNALFLWRDMAHLQGNRSETKLQPFLTDAQNDAYAWIRKNTPPNAAIVTFPIAGAYIPGQTGRAVWAGHWGETPNFADKDRQFARFADPIASDADRRKFLVSTRAQFLLYPNDVSQSPRPLSDFVHAPPPYLSPVYANREWTIFRIEI